MTDAALDRAIQLLRKFVGEGPEETGFDHDPYCRYCGHSLAKTRVRDIQVEHEAECPYLASVEFLDLVDPQPPKPAAPEPAPRPRDPNAIRPLLHVNCSCMGGLHVGDPLPPEHSDHVAMIRRYLAAHSPLYRLLDGHD